MTDAFEVRAAGGVIVRDTSGDPELLLVHRPKYDDWSFPKGKLDGGETFREAALREVLEETALACRAVDALPAAVYRDAEGRLKVVRYWLMEAESGDAGSRPADAEVDAARWMPLPEALDRLTYDRDRELAEVAVGIFEARNA